MADVTYEWKISSLDVHPSLDGLQNVVASVHWRLVASDGVNIFENYGQVHLEPPDPSVFIDYGQLTQEQVLEWTINTINATAPEEYTTVYEKGVKKILDRGPYVDHLKLVLAEALAKKAQSVEQVTKVFPWSNT